MRPELIIVKVSCSAGVLRVSSVGLVVIKLLLERNEQKRKTKLPYLVTYKQRKKVNKDIENECIHLWNEMGMFENEEQLLACQVRRIFKNKRPTEIEIQQLQREIEKVEIAPEIVGTVSEMSYGGWSGTGTVRTKL